MSYGNSNSFFNGGGHIPPGSDGDRFAAAIAFIFTAVYLPTIWHTTAPYVASAGASQWGDDAYSIFALAWGVVCAIATYMLVKRSMVIVFGAIVLLIGRGAAMLA